MPKLDFPNLAATLLARALEFLAIWAPGGHLVGREYKAGSIRGGPGTSFSINIETGAWADFATGQAGGDLTSLYAEIEGIKQGEAAKRLGGQVNPVSSYVAAKVTPANIGFAPYQTPAPPMRHPKYGMPVASWAYRKSNGEPIFYEARYETPEGKQFTPWSWDLNAGAWTAKGYPAPRPLYGLELLATHPHSNVMIVEGPKATDAARTLQDRAYVVITWPNGAQAAGRADWKPIFGRKILIWPDADEPGKRAAETIAGILGKNCPEIKILDVSGQPKGWDAADAVAEGWDWSKFVAWAKPRAKTVWPIVPVVTEVEILARSKEWNESLSLPNSIINHTENHLHVNEEEESPSRHSELVWEELGLSRNKAGPHSNIDNGLRIIERHPIFKDLLWFDEFYQRFFTEWNTPGKSREWNDVDTLRLVTFFQRELGLHKMSDDTIFKSAMVYAHQRTRNAPRDWASALKWDGKKRIDTFFWDCFEVDQNEYSHSIGKNFWIGMVARIFRPGCQLDNMVVLEGAQGIGKTKALRAIGGEWYTEAHESVTSNDFFMVLHGKLIVEIAELDSFSRAEVTRIKQVITSTTDRYRAPYGRSAQDHPRMSIFVGSTNEDAYLRDTTGGRRFWPLKCHRIHLDLIDSNREQLFAEAVHRFKAGEDWYVMPEKEAREQQERRRTVDEWENVIGEFLFGKSDGLTMNQLASECLKIEISKLSKIEQIRIGKIMKQCGWESRFELRFGTAVNAWNKKPG